MTPMSALFAFLVLLAGVLAWDVFMAGQIARLRTAPRVFAALTALCGLLVAPALGAHLATSSLLTSRAVGTVAWVWPITLLLFVVQAGYATFRRLVTPLVGVPVIVFDLVLLAASVARAGANAGWPIPPWLLTMQVAEAGALGVAIGPAALASPFWLQLPLLAPAYPARWRLSRVVRIALALVATAWSGLVLLEMPRAVRTLRGYREFARTPLRERPAGDFRIGHAILPPLTGSPSATALRQDLRLADSVEAQALLVTIQPEGARVTVLDSLARALDLVRRDSALLVVVLAYPSDARTRFARDPEAYTRARVADVARIARRLRPDYLLPADAPGRAGRLALGSPSARYWQSYITRAALAAKRADSRVKIGLSVSAFDRTDSLLYQWASAPGSPIDAVGFELFPGFRGTPALQARLRVADRWMRASDRPGARGREHWVFAAGGYPAAHGERSQEQAIAGILAWATSRPRLRGVIVSEAGDYRTATGLRAPTGRQRLAARMVPRAVRGLRESAGP